MNTNRYFSFSRLGLVMKRDFMENWKTNLYRFLGPYAAFLLVMWFSSMNMTNFNEFSDIVSGTFFSVLFFGGEFYCFLCSRNDEYTTETNFVLNASSHFV